ncbi:MAG: MFS transporter [Novosphingobium sp.]|nr:MFS transporter [Novosphingobium sp.]
MQTSATVSEAVPAPRTASGGWPMVFVFLFFYVVSFIDRSIINMMVQPIERDLGITDFEMSLLLGPAFGIFYVLCGIPIGGLVDRFPRGKMTAIGVAIWGTATAGCGLASSYLTLFIGRMGVGVGESVLTPAAHSLISDTFPKRKLSTALAVYAMGAIVGAGLAKAIGGFVVQLTADAHVYAIPGLGDIYPWQAVFLCVSLFTLLCLPLTALLREGPDGRSRQTHAEAVKDGAATFRELLRAHPMIFLGMPTAFGLIAILANAYTAWFPTFMMRTYGWAPAAVGLGLGIQMILSGFLGQVVGVYMVERMTARGVPDAHVRFPMLGMLVSAPLAIVGFLGGSAWLFLPATAAFYVLSYSFFGYATAGIQQFTPSHLRGRVSALFLAIVTLVGTGLGPPATGLLTEYVFADKAKLGLSLAVVTLAVAPLAVLNLMLVGRNIRSMRRAA